MRGRKRRKLSKFKDRFPPAPRGQEGEKLQDRFAAAPEGGEIQGQISGRPREERGGRGKRGEGRKRR